MSMYIVLHVHTISAYRFQRFQHYNILVALDDAFSDSWHSTSFGNRIAAFPAWGGQNLQPSEERKVRTRSLAFPPIPGIK